MSNYFLWIVNDFTKKKQKKQQLFSAQQKSLYLMKLGF